MIVAVDTGGTKTLVTAFSHDGISGKHIKFQTPRNKDDYIATLKETLHANYGGQRIEAIVIAMPGIVKDGVAIWCPNLGWKNFDVAAEFKGVLGSAPVFVENDANLGGLGETRSRSPMPNDVLYVTVSTGIGTGIISNGVIDPGMRHSEGGHISLYFDGTMREWESFASGRAIYSAYGLYAKDIKDQKIWDEIAERISKGFLVIIPLLQPEVIIIGGSIGTYFKHYAAPLTQALKRNLPPGTACPKIVPAEHPEQAVIYGCYYYAIDHITD